MSDDKPVSPQGAIAIGSIVAAAGAAIVTVSIFGNGEGFHAPRWVVGACGGAFLVFGGWVAAVYALGYDPARPEETLPSPVVQLAVLVPGILLFAVPFHWVAFGRGPREFSTTVSIPLLSTTGRASGLSGRIAFGLGALLIDALLLFTAVRLVRSRRRG